MYEILMSLFQRFDRMSGVEHEDATNVDSIATIGHPVEPPLSCSFTHEAGNGVHDNCDASNANQEKVVRSEYSIQSDAQ